MEYVEMTDLQTVGSKAQVYHGSAKHTSGGLKKKDLMQLKSGRIVSRKKHFAGKKAIKHLFALGYKPKKGKFALFSTTRRAQTLRRKTRKGKKCGGFKDASGVATTVPGVASILGNLQGLVGLKQ